MDTSLARGSYFFICSRIFLKNSPGTAVCYYHSYDFDGTTPGLGSIRSSAVARQLIARGRIEPIFLRLAHRFGSLRKRLLAAHLELVFEVQIA